MPDIIVADRPEPDEGNCRVKRKKKKRRDREGMIILVHLENGPHKVCSILMYREILRRSLSSCSPAVREPRRLDTRSEAYPQSWILLKPQDAPECSIIVSVVEP